MKNNYFLTLITLILIIGTGLYWLNTSPNSPEYNDPSVNEKYVEIIDGEEIILDTPLTKSFSNVDSNRESQEKKESRKNDSLFTIRNTFISKTIQPFVIGIYYLDTIRDNGGFNSCLPTGSERGNQSEVEKYIDDGFELIEVQKSIDQTFVFIDAQQAPEKTCARLLQFKNITTAISEPLHIFVK